MTIASEITRLQWAKATARTSIINKWVAVPVEAKLDTYHDYIDQINTTWNILWWLRLYDVRVSSKDGSPDISDNISWKEWGNYYWCCLCSLEWDSANSLGFYLYTYRKVNSTDDMSYTFNNVTWDMSGSIYSWRIINPSFWTNWENIKAIFFFYSTHPSNWVFCYQAVWDYHTWGGTANSFIWRWESTNISDYNIDLTWYTQITSKERVKSVTWHNYNDDAYIYLTLK